MSSPDPQSSEDPREVPPREPAPGAADEAGTPPEAGPESGEGGRPETPERPSLARDLAEVQRGRPERAFNIGAALGVLLTAAALVFVLQNRGSASFDWLWFTFHLPRWTVLVGSLVVGGLLVLAAQGVHRHRQRRIGRRTEAAGRLRRALGPSESDTQTGRGSRLRAWLGRRRDPMRT